jgi:hypothetical protein
MTDSIVPQCGFVTLAPGAKVMKLFATVIYCHFKVIPSLCVIQPFSLGNYCGMAVNCPGVCVTNVINHNLT